MYEDLLSKSSELLKEGGNLVYLLHTDTSLMPDMHNVNM